VDQGSEQPVQNGEVQLTDLAPGERTIRFKGEGSQATLSVTMSPAAAPQVGVPIQQQNLGATIVSGMGPSAKVITTLSNADASVDGKPAGKIGANGLDLTNLTPGPHEILVSAGQNSSHRLVFDSGPAPAMAVFLGTEKNLGLLRVTTGEDDVMVYVNGDKSKRGTQKGRLLLYLAPRTYTIRVEKDGFQNPTEQTVEVKKGEEAHADFQLTRAPQVGMVLVQKAPPGAEVSVDGTPAGAVRPDGTLPLGAVKPGTHTLAIKKESYRPLTREITVSAGKQLDIDGTLQLLTGTVRVSIAPQEVQPSLASRREGEETTQPFSGTSVSLPEGTYTILGHASEYDEAKTTVKVTAGRETAAVLIFRKSNAKSATLEHQRSYSLADLEKTGGWTKDNNALVRTGGNYILLPAGTGPGTYSFTAMMPKGKRIDWVLAFTDAKNHVAYELSDDRLDRMQFIEGKKQNQTKPRLRVILDEWIQVTLEVSANSIVTTIQQGSEKLTAIDRFESANGGLLNGKFGFRVPGKDRLAVAAFSFTPK
jgi:hypothetical protein